MKQHGQWGVVNNHLCSLLVTLLLAFHSLCAIQIEKTSDKLVSKVQQWRLSAYKQSFWQKKSYIRLSANLFSSPFFSFLFFFLMIMSTSFLFFIFMNSRVWLRMYGVTGLHGDCTFSGKLLQQGTKQYFVQNSLFWTFIRINVHLYLTAHYWVYGDWAARRFLSFHFLPSYLFEFLLLLFSSLVHLNICIL